MKAFWEWECCYFKICTKKLLNCKMLRSFLNQINALCCMNLHKCFNIESVFPLFIAMALLRLKIRLKVRLRYRRMQMHTVEREKLASNIGIVD